MNKLGRYKLRLYNYAVKWMLPKPSKIKCNTNRAVKCNLGQASSSFVVRRDDGTLLYAQAGKLGITINMAAKVTAILEVVIFCA